MWKKIKNFIVEAIIFLYRLLLFLGYFCALDYIRMNYNYDKDIVLIIGIVVACIAMYNEQKKEEDENKMIESMNDKEKNDKFNFVKFIYENNYNNLTTISSISLNNSYSESVVINLKNNEKLYVDVDDLCWIKSNEQLIKLDQYIQKILKIDSNCDRFLLMLNISEEKIDNYLNNNSIN